MVNMTWTKCFIQYQNNMTLIGILGLGIHEYIQMVNLTWKENFKSILIWLA